MGTDRRFECLLSSAKPGYGREALPSYLDGKLRDLLLSTAANLSYDDLKTLMPPGADRVLSTFAERAASIAVRHEAPQEIQAGLIATAVALDLTTDPREVLPALALLYRAGELIDHDPIHQFSAANDLLGGQAPELTKFVQRTPSDRSIQAMAYVEGTDPQGFRFLRTW